VSQPQNGHPPGDRPLAPDAAPAVAVSERLALSLRALGAAGEAWLAGLPGLLASLEADWSVAIGPRLDGGNAAYVAEAVTHDGTLAVLKVTVPPEIDGFTPFERQLAALQLADGDPYVRLIRSDEPRRALLLERLGPPMASTGWPAARQVDALTRTAARGWRSIPADSRLLTGPESARWLARFITSGWEDLGRPCSQATVDLALRCAAGREAGFAADHAVLVHGDVHALNALQLPGPPGAWAEFRLVDAEGLLSEPAHDLGVIQVRGVPGWIDDLLAADPGQAYATMARRCQHAGRLTGADAHAIWQWAFTELVSTGLFLRQLGHDTADTFLAVADRLAAAAG
jgi:streptomycin 6-kinase